MDELQIVQFIFSQRFAGECLLKELGVIRTQKITEDYGEWVATKLFNGTLAESVNEEGWDFKVNDIHYQVKTHCKAETNNASFSELSSLIYPVIIVQLFPNYKIKNIYFSTCEMLNQLKTDGQLNWTDNKYILYWNRCQNITDQFRNNHPVLFG